MKTPAREDAGITLTNSASTTARKKLARIAWKIRMKNLLFSAFRFPFLSQVRACRSTAQSVYVNWNPFRAEKLPLSAAFSTIRIESNRFIRAWFINGFVKGHDFSRAEKGSKARGF
jgi:hypothetical protein